MKKVSDSIVVAMVLIGLCGNAVASDTTYIAYVPITGDADSGISANNTYTHKLDFGTGAGATVNGVAFNAYNAGANGTLQFNGNLTAGRAVLRVHNGGTLSGTGNIGTLVTVNSGAHLAPGADTGTLALGGGLTLHDGVELDIAVDTTGTNDDLINVTGGTFTGSGPGGVTVNVTLSSTETGTYTLMDWTGASASGVETNDFILNLEGFGVYTLDVSGKKLRLNVIGPEGMLFTIR